MKKILLLLVCLCAFAGASYAQKGASELGGNLNYGSETSFGLGLKYRYGITDKIRVEPAINYYLKQDHVSMLEVGANGHYLFPVNDKFDFYPLLGIAYFNVKAHLSDLGAGYSDTSYGKVGLNLGIGADYKLESNIKLNLELKYMTFDGSNQLVLAAGVTFPL